MMQSKFPRILTWASALFVSVALSSCGGGGSGSSNNGSSSSGPFEVLSSTLAEGDVWALNRPIDLVFNHPVDPASISFSSVILKPTSAAILSQPVTGSFSILDGFDGTVVRFTPACPSNEALSNGGFVPGGFSYTLTLPSEASGLGLSVLRDDQGRPLSIGLTRNFTTPLVGEPLFIDSVLGPPQLVARAEGDFPAGLNLFAETPDSFVVRFDQPIETSPTNLSSSRLFFLYSEPDGVTFPSTNLLPGEWLVLDNCDLDGATLRFEPSGILPPGRSLRLQVSPLFVDLSGESNTTTRTYLDAFGQPDDFVLPDLNEFYGDSTPWATTITYDQFSEDFETPLNIDLNADLPLPQVDLPRGSARASFDYPGLIDVPDADDFLVAAGTVITVNTDGDLILNDSNGRPFDLTDGVLNVNDLTIEAGGILRAEGSNPLVLYATGTVDVQGTLDASGDHAMSPVALNQPQIPELGASGQAGGGDGGTASLTTGAATLRGETGFGAFGVPNGGGQGGEGGFQQDFQVTTVFPSLREFLIAGGGGGGGFADGFNEAILWDKWSGEENLFVLLNGILTQVDDAGPDSRYLDRHTTLDPFTDLAFAGAEDGRRGSSWDSLNANHENQNIAAPSAVYGFEDATRDQDVDDEADKYDPAWDNGAGSPVFNFGNPTAGPDAGRGGASVFESTGTEEDDFWGRRVNPDGTTTVGELAGPLAGSGGGASGDLQVLVRQILFFDMNGDPVFAPITDSWPDPGFPVGFTAQYYKGAPGGGGGGQMMIFSVGPIIIGSEALIKVNGGNGAGGEAVFRGHEQVSGSGGGSGGHLVLHSASQLDLSAIDLGLGAGASIAQITDRANANEVGQALGGRRGWSMTFMPTIGTNKFMDAESRDNDGNSDFMAGRGGAGGNGIIQVHVPNPLNDIIFHPNLEPAITADITIAGVTDYADNDNLEAVMRAFMVPTPRVLVPVFATGSQLQSKWIDTGLALKRNPVGAGSGEFISYVDPSLAFDGVITGNADPAQNGRVETTGTDVDGLTAVGSGTSGLTLSSFSGVISSASTRFGGNSQFLTNPQLLLGYDLLPVALARPNDSFEIVAATYDVATDSLTVTTSSQDGDMSDIPGSGGATWQIRPKFFRFDLDSVKDQLPADGFARIEFQGDDEGTPGSNEPSGTPTPWTTDLTDLEGKRFFRYRVTIEMSESGTGFTLQDPRPVLEYFKLPFAW